jgi:hypothetical protein
MRYAKRIGVLSALCLLSLSSCTRTLWVQKGFDSRKTDIDTVTIIFPQIEYSVKYGEVKRAITGYSLFVSRNVGEVLKELVDEGDFGPKSATLLDDSLIIDRWLDSYFSTSMEEFREMWDSTQRSRSGERILPLTPEIRSTVDEVKTRYFIFVTGLAYGTYEGTKQYDLAEAEFFRLFYGRPFIYDYQWEGLQVQIFLVDRESDEVVWYNQNKDTDSRYNPLEKKDIRNLCLKLMRH